MSQDDEIPADDQWQELSLEELGKAYAQAIGQVTHEADAEDPNAGSQAGDETLDEPYVESIAPPDQDSDTVTLSAIIEGALFIGNADNRPISEQELAGLMRGVTPQDVLTEVERLNLLYAKNDQAFRILQVDGGLVFTVASDLETVRRAFYGKVREATLSQGAIEVLALVAYQPGITGEKVQDQRGKESGSLLSQLVRRRLLEQKRVTPPEGGKPFATYYPTERFLDLFGLQSLEDLPHVEE